MSGAGVVNIIRGVVPESGLKMSQPEKRYRRKVRKALTAHGISYEVARGEGFIADGQGFRYRVADGTFYVDVVGTSDVKAVSDGTGISAPKKSRSGESPIEGPSRRARDIASSGLSDLEFATGMLNFSQKAAPVADSHQQPYVEWSWYTWSVSQLRDMGYGPQQAMEAIELIAEGGRGITLMGKNVAVITPKCPPRHQGDWNPTVLVGFGPMGGAR